MDSMLRRLKLRKCEPRETEARKQLQNELFSLDKYLEQGFPYKPTALAYDSALSLLAIGTKSGVLKIYGRPGVQFSGQHKEHAAVIRIIFIPDQGRLVTMCSDSSVHLWEINATGDGYSTLDAISSCTINSCSKQLSISACCLSADANCVYLGTDSGNVHMLSLQTFSVTGYAFTHDAICHSAPSEYRQSSGAIDYIIRHPSSSNKILIGFERGLIVLWNVNSKLSEHVYVSMQQLESLSFSRMGTEFISCHTDGSYIIWTTDRPDRPKEPATTPYGPFPCKAITKMDWKSMSTGDPFMIFSGGMPRASHGDKYTVTIMQGDAEHVVLDFTSKVIDFITICSDHADSAFDEPDSLFVLAEEELVAIDLSSPDWPTFIPPYMCSLHNSAITCVAHATNVPDVMWDKIVEVGRIQFANCSQREWPIHGGLATTDGIHGRDMLLTGHEDGSVRFWDTSAAGVRLLYKLTTASFFNVETSAHFDIDAGTEWPPFRKVIAIESKFKKPLEVARLFIEQTRREVSISWYPPITYNLTCLTHRKPVGQYDPFTDDPRLAIQQICLCVMSEMLIVGGSSGQVIVMQFERDERDANVKISTVGIADSSDGSEGLVWCGHSALEVLCSEGSDSKMLPGFQPFCIVQLQPPVTCLSAALHSEWQLFAVGTAFGFCVFDYAQRKAVFARCTLLPSVPSDKVPISRRKSLQRSIRKSFRRLQRYRSESAGHTPDKKPENPSDTWSKSPKIDKAGRGEGDVKVDQTPVTGAKSSSDASTPCSSLPHQHQPPSAGSITENNQSTVGCLYLADTFLLNAQSPVTTFWVGTNAGTVLIYQLVVPSSGRRAEDAVQCILAKEIRLCHGAPVVSLTVVDRLGCPLPAPLEVQHERAKAPDMTGGHHIVVCSREQIKVFSLPSLKPANKFKFTDCRNGASAQNELRNLKLASFARYRSRSDPSYVEHDLMCLLNTGEVSVFTVPDLRRQFVCDVISRDNSTGINLCVFTQNGKGVYLNTPSEIHQFSVSAHVRVRLACQLDIKVDARTPLATSAVAGTKQNSKLDQSLHENRPENTSCSCEAPSGVADTSQTEDVNQTEHHDSMADGDVTVDSIQIHVNVCETSPHPVVSTIDTTITKLSALSASSSLVTAAIVHKSQDDRFSESSISTTNWNPDMCTLKREAVLTALSQLNSSTVD